MRITFDTNTLDAVARPELAGRLSADCAAIHEALRSKQLEGFFCETVVTIEGVERDQRAIVAGSTCLQTTREGAGAADDPARLEYNLRPCVEQPRRRPAREEIVARAQRALDLGMRILSAPRIGGIRIDDPGGDLYLQDLDAAALSMRLERYASIATAIEARGLGFARVLEVAGRLARSASVSQNWYASLKRASDHREINRVARAITEWADGDSIAAHYAYEADFFCTEDRAKNAGSASVMHPRHRAWLSREYGVELVSISELAAVLSSKSMSARSGAGSERGR